MVYLTSDLLLRPGPIVRVRACKSRRTPLGLYAYACIFWFKMCGFLRVICLSGVFFFVVDLLVQDCFPRGCCRESLLEEAVAWLSSREGSR